jgi:glutamine synthetase
MVGSSLSCADPNTVINTIVAETLDEFATRLEGAKDFDKELHDLVAETIKEHKRILFDGNGYGEAWAKEASTRGLLNLRTTADAIPHLIDKKNISLFTKYGVYSANELYSRSEILLENYVKTVNIEALTMLEMAKKEIYPAVNRYIAQVIEVIRNKEKVDLNAFADRELAKTLTEANDGLRAEIKTLEGLLEQIKGENNVANLSRFYCDKVLPCMVRLRHYADLAESQTDGAFWPHPTYADMLFSI